MTVCNLNMLKASLLYESDLYSSLVYTGELNSRYHHHHRSQMGIQDFAKGGGHDSQSCSSSEVESREGSELSA